MAPTAAQEAKEKGNTAFKAQKYPEAIGHYTAAILADGNDPTFPLNRAAAYLKLGKNFDAERDCSTALLLRPGHVKALFRRAQARVGLENLEDARNDLKTALTLEPTNAAIKSELQQVDSLIAQKSQGKSTAGRASVTKVNDIQKQNLSRSIPESSRPVRRRIPIEIVGDSPSDPHLSNNSLTEVTSRIITPKEPVLSPPTMSLGKVNEESINSQKVHPQTQPATKSSVRGGIFRPSGSHTIFRPQSSISETDGQSTNPNKVAHVSQLPNENIVNKRANESKGNEKDGLGLPGSTPASFYEFMRTWEQTQSPLDHWAILSRVPPSSLPSLFKNALEATLLVQILEACDAYYKSESPISKQLIHEYLHWLTRVPRFGTVTLFLSNPEKALARQLIKAIGVTDGGWNFIITT